MDKYKPEDVLSSFSFSIPIQVRFSDIDGYMHVNNGVYFNYFEHARAEFLFRVCEWDIFTTGTVVANINIDFRIPIHADDKPEAFVRCTKIGNTSFVLEQVLMGKSKSGEDKIFAQSSTTMVFVDMKTMRPVQVPKDYAAKLLGESSKEA
ncbi:acyl-CoA thioesterase [Aquiflexum sp. TKW24L]|uniref:acyl-CoA thioesterase n=1 Tax=Aquiflexum sp. TKW24L TaxID=2942212 RepID=UPI0020BDF87B|nr:thioesterase family protein [Aquiflexum sp. TKW24L]MCL6261274.1 acyl-CoA thioesterase [Aquiflexum sp. TKW24L]